MTDFGANPALAKAEPVARLGPSGFDPGERTKAEALAFTLNFLVKGGHVPGLLPEEVIEAAKMLVEQEKQLATLSAALAAKDHIVTVEVTEKHYCKTFRATAVITDPRIYYGEIKADAYTVAEGGDDYIRHVARSLASVTTRDWLNDIETKTYAALRSALAPTETGTAETENTGSVAQAMRAGNSSKNRSSPEGTRE